MAVNNCPCNTNYEHDHTLDCGCDHRKSKEELLREIMELDFAVNDLSLYLDTHPCCQKALTLHREYTEKLENLKKEYTSHYGPLCIYDDINSWNTWVEHPWPWERGAF